MEGYLVLLLAADWIPLRMGYIHLPHIQVESDIAVTLEEGHSNPAPRCAELSRKRCLFSVDVV